MSGADDAAHLRRLRWQSRRGMRELDQLFLRYLDLAWTAANASERAQFERLLACEDDRLWRWFLGHETPDDPELKHCVRRILALPA